MAEPPHAAICNDNLRLVPSRHEADLYVAASAAYAAAIAAGGADNRTMDEVFVRINGKTHDLWRAVDHEGELLEVFVTRRRDRKAAL